MFGSFVASPFSLMFFTTLFFGFYSCLKFLMLFFLGNTFKDVDLITYFEYLCYRGYYLRTRLLSLTASISRFLGYKINFYKLFWSRYTFFFSICLGSSSKDYENLRGMLIIGEPSLSFVGRDLRLIDYL